MSYYPEAINYRADTNVRADTCKPAEPSINNRLTAVEIGVSAHEETLDELRQRLIRLEDRVG